MKRTQRLALSTILVIVMLAATTLLAAAKELGSITISGPGIKGEVTLTNPQLLMQLQQMGFFDTSTSIQTPPNLGAGYHLTGYLNLDSKVVPFVQAVYYPAADGQSGYIHFTGGLNGDTMQTTSVDRWSSVTPSAGAAFRKLAATQNVALAVAVPPAVAAAPAQKPAQPASASAAQPAAQPNTEAAAKPSAAPVPAISLVGAILLLAAGAAWIRNRSRLHT